MILAFFSIVPDGLHYPFFGVPSVAPRRRGWSGHRGHQREGTRRSAPLGVLAILEAGAGQVAADHLTLTRAADLAVALMTDDVCDALDRRGGWSYDEYQEWLTATLAAQLLRG